MRHGWIGYGGEVSNGETFEASNQTLPCVAPVRAGGRMTLAQRLKQARAMAGLSQPQLAHVLGVGRPCCDKWELRGPPDERIDEICDVLGVSPQWLRTGESEASAEERAAFAEEAGGIASVIELWEMVVRRRG